MGGPGRRRLQADAFPYINGYPYSIEVNRNTIPARSRHNLNQSQPLPKFQQIIPDALRDRLFPLLLVHFRKPYEASDSLLQQPGRRCAMPRR
jgi:hypothetical protein